MAVAPSLLPEADLLVCNRAFGVRFLFAHVRDFLLSLFFVVGVFYPLLLGGDLCPCPLLLLILSQVVWGRDCPGLILFPLPQHEPRWLMEGAPDDCQSVLALLLGIVAAASSVEGSHRNW